jgi:hypothetical protein
VKKVIPFRTSRKKKVRKPRPTKNQKPPTSPTADEEGTITILLKDGTSKTISGRNLELDMEYQEGVPHLVVRERR